MPDTYMSAWWRISRPKFQGRVTLVLVCRDPKVKNMNEHPFCVFCTLGPLDFENSPCHAWEHCFGLIIEWLMKLSVLSESAHILRVLEQGHDVCGWELAENCSSYVWSQWWMDDFSIHDQLRARQTVDLHYPEMKVLVTPPSKQPISWSVRQE